MEYDRSTVNSSISGSGLDGIAINVVESFPFRDSITPSLCLLSELLYRLELFCLALYPPPVSDSPVCEGL